MGPCSPVQLVQRKPRPFLSAVAAVHLVLVRTSSRQAAQHLPQRRHLSAAPAVAAEHAEGGAAFWLDETFSSSCVKRLTASDGRPEVKAAAHLGRPAAGCRSDRRTPAETRRRTAPPSSDLAPPLMTNIGITSETLNLRFMSFPLTATKGSEVIWLCSSDSSLCT